MSPEPKDPIRRIITAVCDVLADEGVSHLSLRKVASKAGATIGLITHYFPTRAAMVKAAVEATWEDERTAVEWPTTGDRDKVINSFGIFLPLDSRRRRQLSVWIAFWALSYESEALREIHRNVYPFVRGKHMIWLKALGFSSKRALVLAERLTMFTDALLLHSVLDSQYWTKSRITRTVADLIDDVFAEAERLPPR
jgi:AcrR family transcriptional regulator